MVSGSDGSSHCRRPEHKKTLGPLKKKREGVVSIYEAYKGAAAVVLVAVAEVIVVVVIARRGMLIEERVLRV